MTHTLITTPHKEFPALLDLSCSEGDWRTTMFTGSGHTPDLQVWFEDHHGCIYRNDNPLPPKIEPEWELVITCPICGFMHPLEVVDSESITCRHCGSCWGIDGTPSEVGEKVPGVAAH